MKKIGIFLAVSTGVVALTSSANASSDCQSIADPMKRLACYDKAAAGKTAAANKPVIEFAAFNPIPAKPRAKVFTPVTSGPRFWLEAEGGVYGFSKNLPVLASTAPPATTGPTPVPTAPGFIGLFTTSTVINPLATGAAPVSGGGGSYRMGYWLDPQRTMAVEGSAFFVKGSSTFAPPQGPTQVTTSNFINTTPDVFVGLFNDTTSTQLNGTISDRLYGADGNFRMEAPHFAIVSNFDVMVGVRYTALDERLTGSVNSVFSRTYQPALGLPPPTDFMNLSSGSGEFRIRNNFIGPQIGFDAEQHWGRFWVANENKVAVGAMREDLSVSGSTTLSLTPTGTLLLAGIPLQVNAGNPAPAVGGNGTPATPVIAAGGPPAFGLFAQGDRSKTIFAVVPSGTIKVGYDIIPDMLSLTLAYNYLYMSNVGRVGDQIASPSDIRQSGFFAQGITLGGKAQF